MGPLAHPSPATALNGRPDGRQPFPSDPTYGTSRTPPAPERTTPWN
ncbi:hypothetical protein B005_0698 [Nocardiopsis alba ATCC BAA-2165]|uniref:Uncharacterized protein n=1 Tax=Nocardiopsis alba (strain ATCC BAA-2165 / BE74) TaxID=1205910 RepID=J7LFV4_NOCAA|nr:hypothetical protein B005_0698 [Nocardiopsis alba ATCC BAA-2165]